MVLEGYGVVGRIVFGGSQAISDATSLLARKWNYAQRRMAGRTGKHTGPGLHHQQIWRLGAQFTSTTITL
ncbi:hypothetical protein PsorP6_015635 [Peronosclerospora sorghi]|uniref:Uncharacterized protein n=1 Tax=Peronosclerospora sorghi TaxID=230839 RepID=A0ACC0WN56_9STRA|nr:hypothetical protein PsorP6_015635 [Peronosclerospora sorghi]